MRELRATYRLQLTPDFGFAAARELVPYLRDMGISHLYLSPTLQARPGSTHGYDVIDPSRLSEDLGGEEGFRALTAAAHDAGLGLVLDVVPNHMAADDGNRYWADPESRERFFDLDPGSDPAHPRWRRFFDIDELAAVRQEDPEVFEATHAKLLELVREGLVDGLRVDHPDGLADPAGYLERLRGAGVERVWVEKILDPGEPLRDWPVSGTVGYEFLNDACALFVDPAGEDALTALWERVSRDARPFGAWAAEAKLEQATGVFTPEIERLARIAGDDPAELAQAASMLPVYRTYVDPASGRVEPADREALAELPEPLRARLLLEADAPAEFVTRFQQTTPAIMAKGVEDTAFSRYCRLLALNDVGGDPSRFGITVEQFHAANHERAERFPENLLTTQTHDAKRSADVRLRIAALAGMAGEWAEVVESWLEMTEPLRPSGAPDDVERLLIFQTLVAAWPIECERMTAYMQKALREAKRNTNWVDQNAEWEDAVRRFVIGLYDHREFCAELQAFAARLARAAEPAVLGQVVLKLTCPGIPDIYQGDELAFRALVDPDNRRPVDFGWRQAMLRRLMGGSPPDAETRKLFIIVRLLGLRGRRPELFGPGPAGTYRPLEAGDSVCAFTRGDGLLVAVATRPSALTGEAVVQTPPGRWRHVLRGEEHDLGERTPAARLLSRRGIAVFERL
jgi:(1->4)-alpha-D-glucan 1-alpha-D-glucosylmutase